MGSATRVRYLVGGSFARAIPLLTFCIVSRALEYYDTYLAR